MRLYFGTIFKHKTTERPQQIKPLFQQKSRDPCQASLYACNKAVRLLKKVALFQHCFPTRTQTNREVTKNKAALSTKKPRSVPGFIARVQQSRAAFEKGGCNWFISSPGDCDWFYPCRNNFKFCPWFTRLPRQPSPRWPH
jgi:hypothetical protein